MTTGWTAAGANTALNATAAAYTWIKWHVGDPGAAGTANPAANTTRYQTTWAAASGGSIANSVDLTVSSVPNVEDYTHFSAWSASTAGTCGLTGTVTANSLGVGDNLVAAAGSLTAAPTLAA